MCDVNWATMCQPKAYPPLTSGIFLDGFRIWIQIKECQRIKEFILSSIHQRVCDSDYISFSQEKYFQNVQNVGKALNKEAPWKGRVSCPEVRIL